jgi:hypothetical protein
MFWQFWMSLWSSSLGTWNATRVSSFCHASLKSVTLRSNVKRQSFVQFPKQIWETVSADEGIQTNSIDKRRQIDRSDWRCSNAEFSRIENAQPLDNATEDIEGSNPVIRSRWRRYFSKCAKDETTQIPLK